VATGWCHISACCNGELDSTPFDLCHEAPHPKQTKKGKGQASKRKLLASSTLYMCIWYMVILFPLSDGSLLCAWLAGKCLHLKDDEKDDNMMMVKTSYMFLVLRTTSSYLLKKLFLLIIIIIGLLLVVTSIISILITITKIKIKIKIFTSYNPQKGFKVDRHTA
jgi:hypothetical protein